MNSAADGRFRALPNLAGQDAECDLGLLVHAGEQLSRLVPKLLNGFNLEAESLQLGEPRLASYSEFRGEQSPGLAACKFSMPPLKAGVGLVIPKIMIAQLVDGFYGGRGIVESVREHFSAAEERILSRFGTRFAEALGQAWSEITSGPVQLVDTITFAGRPLFSPHECIAIQPIVLCGGVLDTLALELLDPVAGLRALGGSSVNFSMQTDAADPLWRDQVIDAVLNVRLPLRTIFARADLPLSDLFDLRLGDIIPICLPNHVPVTVGDRHFAKATVGESNGRTSIRIESMEQGDDHND